MCHVQTAQLDGETNLKLRRAPDQSVALFTADHTFENMECVVECENPTEHFGKFTGKLLTTPTDQVPLQRVAGCFFCLDRFSRFEQPVRWFVAAACGSPPFILCPVKGDRVV